MVSAGPHARRVGASSLLFAGIEQVSGAFVFGYVFRPDQPGLDERPAITVGITKYSVGIIDGSEVDDEEVSITDQLHLPFDAMRVALARAPVLTCTRA